MTAAPVRLRPNLSHPLALPVFPDGVVLQPFSASDAAPLHAVLQLSYGRSRVASFAQWWSGLSSDTEYDPALCFTAFGPNGLVGGAQCWSSGFVKDLAVHPDWRERGLGAALLLTAFHAFRQRGVLSVDLKTAADNHTALRLYQRMGMLRVAY